MEDAIEAISATVEMRDPYTAGHQRRVSNLAAAIAKEMGLQEDRIYGISLAGIVHDLGKIHIPAEILSKPSRLGELEYSMIKIHPQAGYDILKGIDFPWPIAKIVLQHHERLDGSGYPGGLSGDDILLEARILSVADVVESMTSHRPYRPGLGLGAALDEIEKGRGSRYDPEAVDSCLRLFREHRFEFEKGSVNGRL
ncbi:MAG TPA: HD-GYP domain-containing protein [Burkholderiales bacterium]|nr:HD-GYP domain-containing protein [Burkholderiales bacterium]